MQYINKAVSSLFTCLKAQSIHSPETWDSALDFSSFGAIKILVLRMKDHTAVLYVKYVVDTFLFLIISFQMVEALLEEAQEDITPEVGSEVILVDEAGETPGTLHNLDDFLFCRPRCDSCSVMHLCGVPAKEKQ